MSISSSEIGFKIVPSYDYWVPRALLLATQQGELTFEISSDLDENQISMWRQLRDLASDAGTTFVGQGIEHLYSLMVHYGISPLARFLDIDQIRSLSSGRDYPPTNLSSSESLGLLPWCGSKLSDEKLNLVYKHLVLGMLEVIGDMENSGLYDHNGLPSYPNYRFGSGITGRFSCRSDGGLFNPHGVSKSERSNFLPPPGHRMVIADQSAMEMRILAHLSGDDNLISVFECGGDIHDIVARWILKKGAGEGVTERDRRLAKAVGYMMVFGGTPYGLASKVGVSIEESESFINSFFRAFPSVEEWIVQTQIEALEDGYVSSLFGRKRAFQESDQLDAELRTLQNFKVQSSAADINNLSLRGMSKLKPKEAKTLLYLHDGFVLSAPEEKLEETVEIVRLCLEHPPGLSLFGIDLSVPLDPGEIKIRDSWE